MSPHPCQGLLGEGRGHRTAQCRVKVGSADPAEARPASPCSPTLMQDLSASLGGSPSSVRAAVSGVQAEATASHPQGDRKGVQGSCWGPSLEPLGPEARGARVAKPTPRGSGYGSGPRGASRPVGGTPCRRLPRGREFQPPRTPRVQWPRRPLAVVLSGPSQPPLSPQILGLTFAMTMYCQVVSADTYCA